MTSIGDSKERRLENALQQLQAGEGEKGMNELFKLALEDYPEAEYSLGEVYEHALADLAAAAKWYLHAAGHGHPTAQRCIADLYMSGKGVAQDPREAIKWYRAAANQGVVEAAFVMGECCRTGRFGEKNIEEALMWYRRAADAGYDPAAKRIQQFWG